jgi:transcription initiation factor TFIIIB Brf1 subunit/transcription initiation factor TFIIB
MEIEEDCRECGNNEFEHDDVRAEYHCSVCGCIVEDQLDVNVTQFMNSEGQIEREMNSNRLGGDETKTWASTRDASGRPVVYNRQERLRNSRFDRNSRAERTWLKTDVERFIDSPNMPGSRAMKTLAKKILAQTHSTDEHEKRKSNSVMWNAMKEVNNGEDVPLPLNQTRHAQKTSNDDTRNGNYSTRMVAIAVMNIAARIMGIALPTKQLATALDVHHDHLIRESTNIKKYLTIIWKAEDLIIEQGNQSQSLTRMGISPGRLSEGRTWSEADIRTAIDELRPSLEDRFGTMTARLMITEIWAMLEEARGHAYLSGQNIRLVAAGLTVRSTKARGQSRLKQRIADWLGITTNRLKRLEKDYSIVIDGIFNNHYVPSDA